jgi:hypothetical protein
MLANAEFPAGIDKLKAKVNSEMLPAMRLEIDISMARRCISPWHGEKSSSAAEAMGRPSAVYSLDEDLARICSRSDVAATRLRS